MKRCYWNSVCDHSHTTNGVLGLSLFLPILDSKVLSITSIHCPYWCRKSGCFSCVVYIPRHFSHRHSLVGGDLSTPGDSCLKSTSRTSFLRSSTTGKTRPPSLTCSDQERSEFGVGDKPGSCKKRNSEK